MDIAIRHEPAGDHGQYLLAIDGEPAGELDYRVVDGVRVHHHVGVRPDLRGHGLAAELVARALDDARADGHQIVAQCPYVRAHLDRHPEHLDLVDLELSRRLGLA